MLPVDTAGCRLIVLLGGIESWAVVLGRAVGVQLLQPAPVDPGIWYAGVAQRAPGKPILVLDAPRQHIDADRARGRAVPQVICVLVYRTQGDLVPACRGEGNMLLETEAIGPACILTQEHIKPQKRS